ncbi:MAG: matrixin family metalloprotease [bacterium]|nr:matrixin family metalloprotease [bacterium]
MRRAINNILLLVIVGVGIYAYRGPLLLMWREVFSQYFPCEKPIAYSIGSFDARFGISKEEFLRVLAKTEGIWEKPITRELFVYVPNGKLKINLVYDYRQEATEKLQKLGLSVDDSRDSYNILAARFKTMKQEFETQQSAYKILVGDVEQRNDAYNAEVTRWNKRGGAPKDVYERLQEESASLKLAIVGIHTVEDELEKRRDDLNALVTVINQVANNINVSATEFNEIGKARGEEFTEGMYTSDRSGQKIDIYQFNDSAKLVRVLAHEFGHALSLEHVEDPKAIMYRLNQGANTALTPADISALKLQCGIK